MIWPPDTIKEWQRRADRLEILKRDGRHRDAVRAYYAENCADWIEQNCITFDPRKAGARDRSVAPVMPFILFPRQREFVSFILGCLDDHEGGLVEKSRDMGATWLCAAVSVWLWLYHPGSAIGWGSRKEELVDKIGDPSSIFEKIRMIVRRLPLWMLPDGFDWRINSSYMKLLNPANGATITGESGDNIGRGGRSRIFFKDESAHYEHPELIESALGDNTDVQIDISSVCGTGNIFYRRRMAGQIWTPETVMEPGRTRVFIMDWRDHPAKDQPWYDKKRARAEAEGLMHLFLQETDRVYNSNIGNIICPPEWVTASIDAHIKLGFTDAGEKTAGMDVADGGIDKNALSVRHGVVLKHVDDWALSPDVGISTRIGVAKAREMGCGEYYYDCIGVGSGVKSEANRMKEAGVIGDGFRIMPWDASAAVLDPEERVIVGDDDSPLNKDFYYNLKAQGWWSLRRRFYKTWRAVTQGDQYDPAELISLSSDIPKLSQLTEELSQAVFKHNPNGLMLVDKKPEGTKSPNLADSTVICYNPVRSLSILDVL